MNFWAIGRMGVIGWSVMLVLMIVGSIWAEPLRGPGVVVLQKEGSAFKLLRDGDPYYVKGVGGQTNLAMAAEAGANSTRTWDSDSAAEVLDQAERLGMTVTLGIRLDPKVARYDGSYKEEIRTRVKQLVGSIQHHPALLIYALGNELNNGPDNADQPQVWEFVNELATYIHQQDPHHPVMTVLAGYNEKTVGNVVKYAPAIDLLGVNVYGDIFRAPQGIDHSPFKGPYLITEWGPRGHWEVSKTAWGAPVEQSSDEKANSYRAAYAVILGARDRCLGSYVFLWGQKQERTPTWYGMFAEANPRLGLHREALPTVDVMTEMWSEKPPANRAPSIQALEVDGTKEPKDFRVPAGQVFSARLLASDPDGDSLKYAWELLPEATQLGDGGSYEPRPEPVGGAVTAADSSNSLVRVKVPRAGNYRLYGYVLDGHGKLATINQPFQVR